MIAAGLYIEDVWFGAWRFDVLPRMGETIIINGVVRFWT